MRKLAENERAVLFLCGREYWTVSIARGHENFSIGCYNDRSSTYNSREAVQAFTAEFGEPTWTHPNIILY